MGNFVDIDVFKPGDKAAARRDWELPENHLIVLSVAAIKKTHKRIDVLVEEFAQFYMEQAAKLSQEVKYVPLPAHAYKTAWDHVLKNKKGTVFGGTAEVGITIEELLKREAKL